MSSRCGVSLVVRLLTRFFGTFRPDPVICCERCRVDARTAEHVAARSIEPREQTQSYTDESSPFMQQTATTWQL